MRTSPKHARPRTSPPLPKVLAGALVGLLLVIPLLMGAGVTLYGLCSPQSTVRRLILIGYAQLCCLMFLCCSVLVFLLQQWRVILHQSGRDDGAAGEQAGGADPLPQAMQQEDVWSQEQTEPLSQTERLDDTPAPAPDHTFPRIAPYTPPPVEHDPSVLLASPAAAEPEQQTTAQPAQLSKIVQDPQKPELQPLPSALERYEAREEAAVSWNHAGQGGSTRSTVSPIRLEPRPNTSMVDTPAVLIPDASGRYLLQGTALEPDPAQLNRVYRAKKLQYGGHGDLFQLTLTDGTLLELAQDSGSYRLLTVLTPAQVAQQQDGSYRLTKKGLLRCTKAE